jgi:hypothetical protein
MMAPASETPKPGAIATALWLIAYLALGCSCLWTLEWLCGFVGGQLSEHGRSSLSHGHFLAVYGFIVVNAFLEPRQRPWLPVSINPSGNRVLQSLWRETGGITPTWIRWSGLIVTAVLAFSLASIDLVEDLGGTGDRPIGYLAGVGSVVVVAIPYVAVAFAIAKVEPAVTALLRRRPTPAPAP